MTLKEKGVNKRKQNHFPSHTQKHYQRCPPRIRVATGVCRRVSQSWPCPIQGKASDTESCRCALRSASVSASGVGSAVQPPCQNITDRRARINIAIFRSRAQRGKIACRCQLCFCWNWNSQWHWNPVCKSHHLLFCVENPSSFSVLTSF